MNKLVEVLLKEMINVLAENEKLKAENKMLTVATNCLKVSAEETERDHALKLSNIYTFYNIKN